MWRLARLAPAAAAGAAALLNTKVSELDAYRAYTWGNGLGGRLGHSSEKNLAQPVMVEHLPPVTHIVCAKETSYAVTEQGEVWLRALQVAQGRAQVYSWGNGAGGKLGHGNVFNQTSPALIRELADKDVVVQVQHWWGECSFDSIPYMAGVWR